MEIFIVWKANIRRQKGSFGGVFILMMLVSMALVSVLTIYRNAGTSERAAMEHAGFGDLVVDLYDDMGPGKAEALIQKTSENENVWKAEKIDAVYADIEDINGQSPSNSVILEAEGSFDFRIFDEDGIGFSKRPLSLKAGEIGLPISFTSLYGSRIGDKIIFKSQNEKLEYTVKYFFEDPFMGGSMMGIKALLLQKQDLKKLQESAKTGKNPALQAGFLVNVFQKQTSGLSYLKFVQELNRDTGIMGYGWISLGKPQAMNYMLILTNIFSGIMLLFIVLLLTVTLIILSHSVGTSIEMEYVNLGILKAIGFTQGKLGIILTLQYLLAAAAGAMLGMPLAAPIVRRVNDILIPVIGIQISPHMPFRLCLAAECLILGCILLFLSVKLRRLRFITPVRAICQGRENIYFSSRLECPIPKRGLSFALAFRQMVFGGRQYAAAGVITSLLVFFLIVMGNASAGMGEDGKGFVQMFEATRQDMEIVFGDSKIQKEAEETIRKYSEIEKHFQLFSQYLLLDGCQCYCYVIDAPEEYQEILKGRTCKYDNEILVTEFVARDLGLELGDTVPVSYQGSRAEYVISGIYQSANDMGINFAMTQEGYLRLQNLSQLPKEIPIRHMYRLTQEDMADKTAKILQEKYGENIRALAASNMSGGDVPVQATRALTVLMYILAVIFALVVVFLVCEKAFARERRDFGVYKAMGFTCGRLRLQFALRFALISLLGSLAGCILSIFFRNPCMEAVFSLVGISHVEAEVSIASVLLPVIVLTAVFFLFSWLFSGRIKRVEPRILMIE